MKCCKYLSILYLCFSAFLLNAQVINPSKPPLEIENLYNWPRITNQADISNDGKYVFYTVENEIPGKQTIHISNINRTWKKSIIGGSQFQFSKDSKFIIGLDSNSHVRLIKLGTDAVELISGIKDLKIFDDGITEYISYIQSNSELHVRAINSKKERKYIDVDQYHLSPDHKKMLLVNQKQMENTGDEILTWLDLLTNETKLFWRGGKVQNQFFDQESGRIVFFIDNNNQKYARNIWLYDSKVNKVDKIVDKQSLSLWPNLNLFNFHSFENNHLFFGMFYPPQELKKGVDVYSYTDSIPMTIQLTEMQNNGIAGFRFEVVVNVNDKVVRRVADENVSHLRLNDEFGILHSKDKTELINYNTGIKKNLPMELESNSLFVDERILLLRSQPKEGGSNLYSYEISTGVMHDLTGNIPAPKIKNTIYTDQSRFKLLAYLEGSNDVLISDSYDIWRIDLQGKKVSVNITNGFGEKNRIAFGLAELNFIDNSRLIPKSNQNELILASANYSNKDNDLYKISLVIKGLDPKRLTSGGYLYDVNSLNNFAISAPTQIKKSNGVYFFIKSNSNHSPNYFATRDFKTNIQISDVQPELKFNWITSELVTFKDLEGKNIQGVLYKPENFNPSKKYPIIFNIYQDLSQNLHKYYIPELTSAANLNIPYFVSNGYLMFLPDIPVIEGTGYTAAFNSVMGAVKYFSGKAFIDEKKMGLSGHSHGGGETNYIVTHSNDFAAAIAGAGPTDMIGSYGLPTHWGVPNFGGGQTSLGGTPYDKLNMYIKNSPKLFANKLNTPLLLHHNKEDSAVLFTEGLSFFNALWKLGKRVWLLQYDGENHFNYKSEANQLDLTIRIKQFFDHYLKDQPAPIWMTRGIRADRKGIDNGYELDKEIKTPPNRINNYE